jgi:hypothetical protein
MTLAAERARAAWSRILSRRTPPRSPARVRHLTKVSQQRNENPVPYIAGPMRMAASRMFSLPQQRVPSLTCWGLRVREGAGGGGLVPRQPAAARRTRGWTIWTASDHHHRVQSPRPLFRSSPPRRCQATLHCVPPVASDCRRPRLTRWYQNLSEH